MNNPQRSQCDLGRLSPFAAELASVIASVASDIALVVDENGVIRDVATAPGEGVTPVAREWIGRPWVETVTRETRPKIEQMLQEAVAGVVTRRREVNHPARNGGEIPIAYAAIRLGEAGPVLAVGRELRVVAALQQRLLDAQAEIEREYWKQRQAESRYRTLFQVATDAVLIVDAATLTIVDANRAAVDLFDLDPERMIGSHATVGIDRGSRPAVEELLATARATGRPGEIRARLVGRHGEARIAATPFRSDDVMLLLVRASRGDLLTVGAARLARMVELMPDALVVCDAGGRVQVANRAFVQLVRLADEAEVRGRSLGDWLDPTGDDLRSVLATTQRLGIAARMSARLQPHGGGTLEVAISAVLLPEGEQTLVGMILRPQPSDPSTPALGPELTQAIERLAAQIGAADLPALVRTAAEIAERELLSAALRRCAGDITCAAALLRLAPEDLRQRLRSHCLDGGRDPSEDPGPLVPG